jgi:ATP-dependent RNA helicase DeaD
LKTFQLFTELGLPLPLAGALKQMNFVTPTPVQAATIPAALQGKDILATAQTGTGKTGAFGVPLLTWLTADHTKQALILAPTRELAAQIHAVLRQMGGGLKHKGVLVVGGESFHRQADDLYRGADYIVATPGRLNDHLQERTVDLSNIGILVLDEVDRMLDMGFAPQIRQIMQYIPKERQTLLFSATLPREITNLAGTFLRNPVRVEIGQITQSAPQVKEETIRTTNEGKTNVLLKEIKKRDGKILIFTRTKSRAERLARSLHKEGHQVVCLHGGKTQSHRKQALDRFRTGRSPIMVATDLAGRGIDVPDIEHVINYDVPANREDYIHRIGRTGRAGKTGLALNLLCPGDFDGENVVNGVKPKSRVVFRSRTRPRSMR